MTNNYFVHVSVERQWLALALGFVGRRFGHTFAIVIWPLVIEIGKIG